MRVHELAKELGKTSKEILEAANEKLGLALKSHSSTITEAQIQKIKGLYTTPKQATSAKPKAFIVKKQKTEQNDTIKAQEEPKNEDVVKKSVSKLEVVRSSKPAEKPKPKAVKVEKNKRKKKKKTNNKNLNINRKKLKILRINSLLCHQ